MVCERDFLLDKRMWDELGSSCRCSKMDNSTVIDGIKDAFLAIKIIGVFFPFSLSLRDRVIRKTRGLNGDDRVG